MYIHYKNKCCLTQAVNGALFKWECVSFTGSNPVGSNKYKTSIPYSLKARIFHFHWRDRGSIPRMGKYKTYATYSKISNEKNMILIVACIIKTSHSNYLNCTYKHVVGGSNPPPNIVFG